MKISEHAHTRTFLEVLPDIQQCVLMNLYR